MEGGRGVSSFSKRRKQRPISAWIGRIFCFSFVFRHCTAPWNRRYRYPCTVSNPTRKPKVPPNVHSLTVTILREPCECKRSMISLLYWLWESAIAWPLSHHSITSSRWTVSSQGLYFLYTNGPELPVSLWPQTVIHEMLRRALHETCVLGPYFLPMSPINIACLRQ